MATVFRHYRMELFDTVRIRDVDHARDYCFVGMPSPGSKGVRVKNIGRLEE